MPAPVSRAQQKFMHAITEGKVDPSKVKSGRGAPPKAIAAKYSGHSGTNLPETSGSNTGGTWDDRSHSDHLNRMQENKEEKKRQKGKRKNKAIIKKKKLKKSFEEFYKGKGAGCIVLNNEGAILIGKQSNGKWATPGGHVDSGETYKEAAIRELKEETGLKAKNIDHLANGKFEGNTSQTFIVNTFSGKIKDSDELKNLTFKMPKDIPFDNMRPCSLNGIGDYLGKKLSKSTKLSDMLIIEALEKNIIRSKGDAVFEMTHGDSLRLVGNGAFRMLRNIVKGMTDEDFKDVNIGDKKLSIRKHVNDVYSGRIYDGQKMVHEFTNRSLPALTAEIMSVFEWYLPEDEKELELLDENDLGDDIIEGGINELITNYKKHNLANIYDEMNTIRSEIRNGNAIDIQEVEKRMLKLFDKLEATIHDIVGKHNSLSTEADNELCQLEAKLLELQSKVDSMEASPKVVEAYSTNPGNPDKHLDDHYCYLPKPIVEISPDGRIKISFGEGWSSMDRENLLNDMKAKVIGNK